MAIPAQGCVFTWGTSTVQEIQELELRPTREQATFAGSRTSAGGTFFYIGREMTLVGFSVSGLEQNKIGQWQQLKITVRVSPTQKQVLYQGWSQYLSSSIRASVNGAVQFAYQFRLWGAYSTIGTLENI
jgi:hypothetical protein